MNPNKYLIILCDYWMIKLLHRQLSTCYSYIRMFLNMIKVHNRKQKTMTLGKVVQTNSCKIRPCSFMTMKKSCYIYFSWYVLMSCFNVAFPVCYVCTLYVFLTCLSISWYMLLSMLPYRIIHSFQETIIHPFPFDMKDTWMRHCELIC